MAAEKNSIPKGFISEYIKATASNFYQLSQITGLDQRTLKKLDAGELVKDECIFDLAINAAIPPLIIDPENKFFGSMGKNLIELDSKKYIDITHKFRPDTMRWEQSEYLNIQTNTLKTLKTLEEFPKKIYNKQLIKKKNQNTKPTSFFESNGGELLGNLITLNKSIQTLESVFELLKAQNLTLVASSSIYWDGCLQMAGLSDNNKIMIKDRWCSHKFLHVIICNKNKPLKKYIPDFGISFEFNNITDSEIPQILMDNFYEKISNDERYDSKRDFDKDKSEAKELIKNNSNHVEFGDVFFTRNQCPFSHLKNYFDNKENSNE